MASSRASSDSVLHAVQGTMLGLPAGFVQRLWLCLLRAVHSAVEPFRYHESRPTSSSFAARTKLSVRVSTLFSPKQNAQLSTEEVLLGVHGHGRAGPKTGGGMRGPGEVRCWAAPQGSSQLRQCARRDGAVQMGRRGVQQNGPRRDCRLQPVDRHHAATCTHRALTRWQGKEGIMPPVDSMLLLTPHVRIHTCSICIRIVVVGRARCRQPVFLCT